MGKRKKSLKNRPKKGFGKNVQINEARNSVSFPPQNNLEPSAPPLEEDNPSEVTSTEEQSFEIPTITSDDLFRQYDQGMEEMANRARLVRERDAQIQRRNRLARALNTLRANKKPSSHSLSKFSKPRQP